MNAELSTLTGKSNFFEDFTVGEVYEHARGKTVENLENVLITNLVLNTAQAHFNEHLAETLPQGHRITFGGVTASLIIGLTMQDTGENAVEEVGLDRVRFRVPVLHGDTLYAFTEVVSRDDEPSNTRGHRDVGLVHFRHWGVNQRGETVFEGERRVLVKKRAFTTKGLEISEESTRAEIPKPAPHRSLPPKRRSAANAKTRTVRRARMNSRKAKTSKGLQDKPRGRK
jgi:itaconyl-CoA hydratase